MKIDSLHYHTSSNITEANRDRPSQDDIIKYKISFSDWFETQKDYLKIVSDCPIYFAPRESEGIGLSFIEALSLGLCVVAPDAPTMNEYITNGINGILYDPYKPHPISLSDIDHIRERALSIAKQAYTQWLDAIPNIIDFIKRPLAAYKPHRHHWIFAKRYTRSVVRHIYKKMIKQE
jgi:glycosyltransferase involved in cell wall biosynthesis